MAGRLDKFLGCMYGLALGDTLGFQVEFLPLNEIRRKYGDSGITDILGQQPIFSDDTQMSLATAQALINSPSKDSLERIMQEVSREYVVWLKSPKNNRAPGLTCITGCKNLARGDNWRKSGVRESKGCGAAMRTAPIGLFFKDMDKLIEIAYGSSICTHAHDTGIASGIATALITNFALNDFPLQNILAETKKKLIYAGKKHNFNPKEMTAALDKVASCLSKNPETAIPRLGQGWTGEEAVSIAAYSFLRTPGNYKQAILTAANIDGDSDSTACITGAFSGAYNGVQVIPKSWLDKLEKREHIKMLTRKLFEKSEIQDKK